MEIQEMTNHSDDTNCHGLIRRFDEQGKLICDLTKNQEDFFEYDGEQNLIVPPGLIKKMYEFHALIETSRGKPILITGPTGVGKSLFIHMYKEWFIKKNGQTSVINRVNCSHFVKELARSELFGHLKGAFTGAIDNKKGWIEETDGGLLILEEVGELSNDCQAQLLTFIEDGYYHSVGANVSKRVKNLSMIGTTNKLSTDLRPDFWNRFLTFEIPPIYKRRGDILYYIAANYPEMIKELHPRETLALLAYNWPANVREINKVTLSIKTRKYLRKINTLMGSLESKESEFQYLEKEHTALSMSHVEHLFHDLLANKVDVVALERVLNRFFVGVYEFSESLYFNNIDDSYPTVSPKDNIKMINSDRSISELILQKEWLATEEKLTKRKNYIFIEKEINDKYEILFNVRIMPQYLPFSNALYGYFLFCDLFFLDDEYDVNNINVRNRNWPQSMSRMYQQIFIDDLDIFKKVIKQCFEYMSGISLPADAKIPLDFHDSEDFYFKLYNEYPNNEFLASINFHKKIETKTKAEVDIFAMTEKEFTKYYYEGLLKRYPTARKIAEVLDIKEQTMYSKLRSLKKEGIIS
jgi:transcriptional regulator with AAA-type ATPase domain